MEIVLKILTGSLMLLVMMMQNRVAAAETDVEQNQDKLIFSSTETVLLEELDNARGREGVDITTLNNMNIRATLTGNQASNNINGYNIIDNGSFAQASGITSVIQNSGNNVIIQDSTTVNVTIIP